MYDGPMLGGTTTSFFVPPATQLTVYASLYHMIVRVLLTFIQDPSDPSTFSTSLAANYQNNSTHSNIYHPSQGGHPGSYSGAPEL